MTTQNPSAWQTPGPWLGLIMGLGTPCTIFAFNRAGWMAALALAIVFAALAIGVTRRFKGAHVAKIYGSSALVRYNMRLMLAMMSYVAGLMIAIAINAQGMPPGPLAYLVALLPTIPALGVIFVIARYLVEETDEYLRHRASLSAIIGMGFVLVLGTVWGFLETFGLAPHIWAWWVVPVWAIGLAFGQAWITLRERTQDGDDEGDDEGEDNAAAHSPSGGGLT